ncbi:unnamed protein product [Alternaria alternata]
MAYSAGKTFAEKAAWDFLAGKNPAFDIAVINPPMVFGPVINGLETLDNMNTSNQRILEAAQGKFQDEIPDNNLLYLWVDVRDVAAAHVAALEQPAAANKRFFTVAGYYSHREILAIIEKRFPEYNRNISAGATPGGDYPDGGTEKLYKYSNKRSVENLGDEVQRSRGVYCRYGEIVPSVGFVRLSQQEVVENKALRKIAYSLHLHANYCE